jgi:hypothetical protein
MVLSFANREEFRVGRSHLADVSEQADPFVSRINSTIAYRNGISPSMQAGYGSGTTIRSTGRE